MNPNDYLWRGSSHSKLHRGNYYLPSIAALFLLIIALFSPLVSINLLGEKFDAGNFYTITKAVFTQQTANIQILSSLSFFLTIMVIVFFAAMALYAISAAGFNSKKFGAVASFLTAIYVIIFFIAVSEAGGNLSNAGTNIYLSLAAIVAYFWIGRR